MHKRLQRARDVAVVDEEIFFNIERRVAAFQITGAIVFDAMSQDKILRACWRANRISLDELHLLKCAIERCPFWKITRDRESSQVVETDEHSLPLRWKHLSRFSGVQTHSKKRRGMGQYWIAMGAHIRGRRQHQHVRSHAYLLETLTVRRNQVRRSRNNPKTGHFQSSHLKRSIAGLHD